MTVIYCVKCCSITNTKQEKRETTANRWNRLSSICVACNTKKGMFVNSKWKIHEKTPDEREKAESYKIARSLKKEALRIG